MTRSLTDFSKLIEVFEKHKISLVSVTQQFEREITGERIRNKLAASKKKGIWMGSVPPLGYENKEHKFSIVENDTAIVREIFDRFIKTQSATAITKEM